MDKKKFRIKVDPQNLVPNDLVRKYYYTDLLLIALMVAVISLSYSYLPRLLPLFFTKPWGIERLVPKPYIVILPILALIILIVNIVIGKMLDLNENKVLVHSLGIGSLITSLTLTIGLVGIIQSIL